MTFKTKFKIGQEVFIKGNPHMIEELSIDVGSTFRFIHYRFSPQAGSLVALSDIREEALLEENPLEKR